MATKEERQAADQARAVAEGKAHAEAAAKQFRAEVEQDHHDYQDWLDGKAERPTDGAARLAGQAWRERSGIGILRQILEPYKPTAKTCPQCVTKYIGSSQFCPPCTDAAILEHDRRAAERAAKVDGMTVHEARHRWANLPPDAGRSFGMVLRMEVQGLPDAIIATQRWVDVVPRYGDSKPGPVPPWLLLTGSVGIGKSHLAEVAARELVARGERVRWQPVGELLDRLRADYRVDGENAYAHLAAVAATPWLVLDDLGKSKPTGWVLDTLYMLINSRTVRQARTLITTNDTLPELTAKLGDAIADRVFDTHSGLVAVVTISGPSFRTGR